MPNRASNREADIGRGPAAGESAAFEALFIRYKNLVFRTAWGMVGDRSEAEDVLQGVFLKVYEHRGRFRGDEIGLRRWLYRVTINHCIDLLRQRRPCLDLDKLCTEGLEPAAGPFDHSLEVRDEFWRAIACLDARQRAVVVLRYLHDLPYAEIAQVLAIPLGTVKSRLNAAVRTMRERLVKSDEL